MEISDELVEELFMAHSRDKIRRTLTEATAQDELVARAARKVVAARHAYRDDARNVTVGLKLSPVIHAIVDLEIAMEGNGPSLEDQRRAGLLRLISEPSEAMAQDGRVRTPWRERLRIFTGGST